MTHKQRQVLVSSPEEAVANLTRTSHPLPSEPDLAALREGLLADVTALAHLKPEEWDLRRGGDPIARTINAVRDIINARFDPTEPKPDHRLCRCGHDEAPGSVDCPHESPPEADR